MERIYLDNAATTRVRPEVAAEVLPIMTEVFGNASSVHAFGREGKKALSIRLFKSTLKRCKEL